MSAHSIIPPSSAARRKQCPGSARLELEYPETEETEEAIEGTQAHEVAAAMINNLAHALPVDLDLETAFGFDLYQTMFEGAKLYAEHCGELMRSTGVFGGPNLRIEQRVHAPRIHADCWGTPDFALWHQAGGTLYVRDFKYGHRIVDIFECWQLLEYAIGLLDEVTGGNGLADQAITVNLGIIQPRAPHRDGPIRTWRLRGSDLRGYANILHDVEHEALGPDPTFRTGPECRDCKGRHVCELLQRVSMGELSATKSNAHKILDADGLAIELRMLRHGLKAMKARTEGLEAQAEAMLKRGAIVPGFSLDPTYGRERWAKPDEEVFQLGDMLGIDVRKSAEPVTPKQAIAAGLPAEIVRSYAITPKTGVKLVENDTKPMRIFTYGN